VFVEEYTRIKNDKNIIRGILPVSKT